MSNSPPSAENASPELRGELLKLQALETSELLKVAKAEIAATRHERQAALLESKQDRPLTDVERQELTALRIESDQLMLKKTYAWSVLRWRGQRVLSFQALPIPQ